jgi:hypothetical protein
MSYPSSIDTIPNVPANTPLSGPPDHTDLHNQIGPAIEALETKLGTGASTPIEGEVLTGTSTGSVWSAPASVSPSGNAGGDLSGTYPNPILSATSNVESIISSNSTVTGKAPLASPALTGIPTAPTATTGTNTTQIATTAFVNATAIADTPAATFTTNGTVKQTVYNVRDYGATGNGSTDDTAAFNSANTAATSAQGVMYVPHGIYMLNATNLNPITASMLGESMNGSILKLVASFNATQNLIRVVSVTGLSMRNLTIDGNKSSVSGGTQYGLYLSTTTDCGAENILSKNWTGVGTHFYNNNRAFATNCYSTANTYHGFEFEQNTNGTYHGLHGYSNTLHGVLVDPGEVSGTGSRGNTFTDIQCDSNSQYGLAFNAANGNVSAFLNEGDVFTNVSLTNNSQYGLNIFMQNKQIFNNLYIYNNGFFGIYLFESSNNTFNNTFLHNNSQASAGSYDEIYSEGYSTSSSHPSSYNIFNGGQILIDGSTKARYAVNEGTANDGNNTYVDLIVPNAGSSGKFNILSATSILAGQSWGVGIASNATIPSTASDMGVDAPFGTAALRLYNGNSGGNVQVVTPNGTTEYYVGGNNVANFTNSGIQIPNGYGFQLATSPTNGYVLTSDSSGNGTWQSVSGGTGITRSINSISTATIAGATTKTDYVYLVTGTTTLTIPTAVSNTNRYTIKNVGSNTVSIATTSSQTIDGSSSPITLPVANTSLDLISNGSNWNIV